jgi:anthranilate phosphoribosyltransferase
MSSLNDATELCRKEQELPAAIFPGLVDGLCDDKIGLEEKAAFLRALGDKGETAGEIHALAEALLPRAIRPGLDGQWHGEAILDCSGTGGGGQPLMNISTGMIFILSAAGVPVMKHGNRGVTKKSGSADVLEALEIEIELSPAQLRQCMEQVGMGFIFAPSYHPAFAQLAPVRQLLAKEGRRTVFNLLGPVLNPARPATQLVGVFQREHLALYGEVLRRGGRQRYLAVFGMDGESGRPIGELSVGGANEYASGLPEEESPAKWAIPQFSGALREIEVRSARESAQQLAEILSGKSKGLGRALLVANAAAGLCVQGKMHDYAAARARAEEALESGAAAKKLRDWQDLSRKFRG